MRMNRLCHVADHGRLSALLDLKQNATAMQSQYPVSLQTDGRPASIS